MTAAEGYTPKPGDEVLLTVRATMDGEGGFLLPPDAVYSSGRGAYWIHPGEHVVRVEPVPVELPTGFGARIRATVESGRRLTFVRAPDGDSDQFPWVFRNPGDGRLNRRVSEGLSDVEVLDAGEPS